MSAQSKKMKMLFALLIAVTTAWSYKTYERRREVREFFANAEDLEWANQFLDKKINLCNIPWAATIIVKRKGKDVYFSPSGRFEIKWNDRYSEDADFFIENAKSRGPFDYLTIFPKYVYAQWAMEERFLIHSQSIDLDKWWVTPKIFISNVATGKTIHLGKSEIYDCDIGV